MCQEFVSSAERPEAAIRDAVHDLRNLFGIIVSARHLLSGEITAGQRSLLLDAIENSAIRGGRLATDLLASSARQSSIVDVDEQLARIAPMVRGLVGGPADLAWDLRSGRAQVNLDPISFDAAIVELVTNARKALGPSGRITLRSRCSRNRVWLIVADNGCGMTASQRGRMLNQSREQPGAHGTGLGFLQQFAQDAGGRLWIRSREGQGTAMCLIMPAASQVATRKLSSYAVQSQSVVRENEHADRQPIAA